MASWEATTVVHVNQRRLVKLSVVSSTQSMNIAKNGFLAIEVDFLARAGHLNVCYMQ